MPATISSPASTARSGSSSWAMGSAEKGENGIAHEPRDQAFILVDRLDHVLEGAVDDLGPIFGVQLFGGGGRTFDITEENRDHAPFTLHGATRARRFQFGSQFAGQKSLDRRLWL